MNFQGNFGFIVIEVYYPYCNLYDKIERMTTEFTENGVKDKIGYVLSLVGAGGTFYFTYFINSSLVFSPARGISALVGFGASAFLAKTAADNPNGRLINMAENLLTVESTFLSIVAGFKVLMGGVNKSTLTICAVTRESMDGQATV